MSTALRIASVTYLLRDLLNNGLIERGLTGSLGGDVIATALPPDKVEIAPDGIKGQLNLFMYHVTYNQGWRNVAQPAFNGKGERITNPPLAIDLHYLLTAYGSGEIHSEILLGHGMQLFHETPVLSQVDIGTILAENNLPDGLKLLATSDLAEQTEHIRITPESLSIEDMSKLWAAFATKYRPTAAYKATVVLIESQKSTKPGLPVKERNIYVIPLEQLVIESILSQSALNMAAVEDQKILNTYRLVVRGQNLTHNQAQIMIDGVEISAGAGNLITDDAQASFNLPVGLRAGLHEVRIAHPVLMGSPPVLHKGVTSNAATFVLSPRLSADPVVTNVTGSGNALRSADIKLTIEPAIEQGQQVALQLNEVNGPGPLQSYSFVWDAPSPQNPPQSFSDISFSVKEIKQGNYLVRIRVDGAESPLNADAAGVYSSPGITIP